VGYESHYAGPGFAARASAQVTVPSRAAAAGGPTSTGLPGGFKIVSPGGLGEVTPTLIVLVLIEAVALAGGARFFRKFHGG